MHFDYTKEKIMEYKDFVGVVEEIGFLPFSDNCIGFTNLSGLTLDEQWHTDLPSDPWKWRIKIEEEHRAAYAKLFDKKPGFISLEWYPVFLAAKRGGQSFYEMYQDGLMSEYAKRIYMLFEKNDILAAHEIKALCGITKETNSKFESALCELQMRMFITTSGTKLKISAKGDTYGWPSTAYSTAEKWAGDELIESSYKIRQREAADMILERISDISPDAEPQKIRKFLGF